MHHSYKKKIKVIRHSKFIILRHKRVLNRTSLLQNKIEDSNIKQTL